MTALDCLIEVWIREGIQLLPPKHESEVRRAFANASRQVSEDVVQIYSKTGGMAANHHDGQLIELWSFDLVVEEMRKSSDSVDFEFADVMMGSHGYAFRVTSPMHAAVRMHLWDRDSEDYEWFKTSTEFFEQWLEATRSGEDFWGLPKG